MQTKVFQLRDESATIQLGCALSKILEPGLIIYLYGDLGAGKTTLTRAIIQATGYRSRVKSPTYTLVEPYELIINNKRTVLLHFDLYRMCSAEEFIEAGFRDEINNETISIIEWPEKANDQIPPADLAVYLEIEGDGRIAKCSSLSKKGNHCLTNLKKI